MAKKQMIEHISYDDIAEMAISLKNETYSSPLDPEIADFLGDPSATEVFFRNRQFQTNNGFPVESSVWHSFDPRIMAGASGGDTPLPREGVESLLDSYGLEKGDYIVQGTSIDLRKRLAKNDFEKLSESLNTYSIKNGNPLGYKMAAGGALAMFGVVLGASMTAGCIDEKKTDSDKDGIMDWDEKNTYKTDPKNPDTDNDGLSDGLEINQYHTNPLKADSDNDGLNDNQELNQYHTDPLKADTDSDGFSDGFEVNVAKLDPNVANDRYVLISSRNTDHEKGSGGLYYSAALQVPDMYEFLTDQTSGAKIPKENVIYLQKPSYSQFKNAIDEISRKADGDDLVFIELHGETRTLMNQFGTELAHDYLFSDKYVSPYEIGNLLDKIHAKSTVVCVELCRAGYFLDEMKDNGRIVITGSDKTQASPNADVGMYFFEAMGHNVGKNYYDHYTLNENPDKDGNGYVSVKEAFDIVKNKMSKIKLSENSFRPNTALFSDPSGIAGSTYLMEFKLPTGYKV
jgi:hypothetical protein